MQCSETEACQVADACCRCAWLDQQAHAKGACLQSGLLLLSSMAQAGTQHMISTQATKPTRSPTGVSYPRGSLMMNPWQWAARAAASMPAWSTPGLPYEMFWLIVALQQTCQINRLAVAWETVCSACSLLLAHQRKLSWHAGAQAHLKSTGSWDTSPSW